MTVLSECISWLIKVTNNNNNDAWWKPEINTVDVIFQVCELHVAGYKFSVLNNAFLIHRGLKTTMSFHETKDLDQERNRLLFRQFKIELREKYPESSRRCY